MMQSEKGDVDIGMRSPGLQKPAVALATLYICVCGLCSLCPGPLAILLSAILLLSELLAGARFLDTRHPTVPYLLMIWMLTAYCAALVGLRNHNANYFPYRAGLEGRTYDGIGPTVKASAHADGGIIKFTDDATLAVDQSVGFIFNGHVYCAAPIVSGANPTGEVQFFAVGSGCCQSRGGFSCDDASSQGSAKGGLVWHEPLEGTLAQRFFLPGLTVDSARPAYMKAAKASMVLNSQEMASEPVFLRWVAQPRNLLRTWLTIALLVWITSSIIFGIFISLLWFVIDFHFDRILRGHMSDAMTGRTGHASQALQDTAKPQGNLSSFSLPWRTTAQQGQP